MTLMTLKKSGIALVIAIAALTALPSWATDSPQPTAEEVRDQAISKLVGWRTKSAQSILEKAVRFEESQPWLTAEAFLMATYGIGQDEKTVTQALEILGRQTKKTTADPVSEFFRGEVLHWLGDSEKANIAWKNANQRAADLVEKNSKDARAQYYLGASFVRLNNPAEGRKALKKAERLDFDKPMVDFQTGLSYMLQKNWKAAKSSFDAVHELDPRYAHLYFYRGLVWDKLGRKDQLLSDLNQFVKLAPNSPEAKKARAILKSVG